MTAPSWWEQMKAWCTSAPPSTAPGISTPTLPTTPQCTTSNGTRSSRIFSSPAPQVITDQITQLMTKMKRELRRTKCCCFWWWPWDDEEDDSDDQSNKEINNQCSTPRMDREDLGQRFDKAVVHVWLKLTGKIGFLIRVYLQGQQPKKMNFHQPP